MQAGLEDCQTQGEGDDVAGQQGLGEVEGSGQLQEHGWIARRQAQEG